MENASRWFPPKSVKPKEAVEDYLYHMYFTTYAFWIGTLAAVLHVTLPNPPSIVADAAFAITFGVLVVGSGIAGDWGARPHSMYAPSNLISHVLPFLLVLGALKGRPSAPSALWKICVAACIPGLMYEFSCGQRANYMYKRFSPASDTSFMIPILGAATVLGALVRSYV
ncbi:MAG: hypothetical protein CL454_00665 [Acidimicrobiaceae bacterium]|nr:hypothetical protein [Acidimicrobiaceae bacterium]|tara:strand:- start:2633 stop:3139 length:507 start_codon:yes stop_codon:yes gene_type:complete